MAKKKHTLESALKSLSKKQDVRINTNGIFVLKNEKKQKHDLGNGSWGKIDFLNKQGLRTIFVNEF